MAGQIGRITGALAAIHNENSLALANVNFDFTLVKLEAPKEFSTLGTMISPKRKINAEEGSLHKTARRLGALFEENIPPTDALFRAYGRRVSEICELPSVNPQPSLKESLFAHQIGVDATSIWAAATSGEAAIAVHLLACMLARIFTGPEAVSVWVELVSKQKKHIGQMSQEAMYASKYEKAATASLQEISRTELADWDASARAWLQSADQAKTLQHNQLKVILNGVNIPINNVPDMYDSVIKAWTAALKGMDNLLRGMPQRVSDGAALLGMSSWHMYPDMSVLGAATTHVQQRDALFSKTAILTLGLKVLDSAEEGVSWSLPLACLQYYGHPVQASRSMVQDAGRVTFDQFIYMVLGCIFSAWGRFAQTNELGFQWLRSIASLVQPAMATGLSGEVAHHSNAIWLNLLVAAMERFEDYDDIEQRLAEQLIALGRRRSTFLYPSNMPRIPLFGLSHMSVLLPLLQKDELRIEFLRYFAKQERINNAAYVIRYRPDNGDVSMSYELVTVAPVLVSGSLKRTANGSMKDNYSSEPVHICWLPLSGFLRRDGRLCDDENCLLRLMEQQFDTDYFDSVVNAQDARIPHMCQSPGHAAFWTRYKLATSRGNLCLPVLEGVIEQTYSSTSKSIIFSNERSFHGAFRDLAILSRFNFESRNRFKTLNYVAGDMRRAAIFSIELDMRNADLYQGRPLPGRNLLQPQHMNQILDASKISPRAVFRQIFGFEDFNSLRTCEPQMIHNLRYELGNLKACAAIGEIYKLLPEATISTMVASRALSESKWVQNRSPMSHGLVIKLSRAQVFSCISMLDSGICDLDPFGLEEVFAMSSGNSLYVDGALLCDPYETTSSKEIRRIAGNVGRPGISLLVPPPHPKIREADLGSYLQINHAQFDGEAQDCFRHTTVHLSFTAYEMPLKITNEHRHIIDRPANLVETLISVYDHQQWIADIDIMKTLSTITTWHIKPVAKSVTRLECDSNIHNQEIKVGDNGVLTNPLEILQNLFTKSNQPYDMNFTSIDNWDELLDPPDTVCVLRAHGNWLARLSLMSVCWHLEYVIFVLPKNPCWSCCGSALYKCRDGQSAWQKVALVW
ncbi:hypothetical protein PVAG01_04538 [Phlyctema vagabunda]|uniref:Uncharacterized protein n=1 Tax=Phlyctema vagabunda TaxID=108571 RepID=A0ABR4PHH8_9HELO